MSLWLTRRLILWAGRPRPPKTLAQSWAPVGHRFCLVTIGGPCCGRGECCRVRDGSAFAACLVLVFRCVRCSDMGKNATWECGQTSGPRLFRESVGGRCCGLVPNCAKPLGPQGQWMRNLSSDAWPRGVHASEKFRAAAALFFVTPNDSMTSDANWCTLRGAFHEAQRSTHQQAGHFFRDGYARSRLRECVSDC